jgi:hypothetical protein
MNQGMIGKCHPSMMPLRAARDAHMMFDPQRNVDQDRNAGTEKQRDGWRSDEWRNCWKVSSIHDALKSS